LCYHDPRVRILMDYRPALVARSGVGEYVHELASALVGQLPRGDRLFLFSSSWKDRLRSDTVAGAGVVDARVPVRLLNLLWHRLEWPPVETFGGAADVVHSLHPLLMPARSAARGVTVHDLDFLDHPERTRAEIRRDYGALTPAHVRRADAVVTVSRFTAGELIRRFDLQSDRIFVCSPGAPAWAPRAVPPRPDAPILFMGTLEPRKNVGTLLRAYARLREQMPSAPRLVLAGGRTPASDEWLRMASAPPLAGHVDYVGYVSGDRRRQMYEEAGMLVLPSHHEGFGLPVLEAMTVGVPVVASRRGALPEVAGDAASFVEPDDEAGLAEAMAGYLRHPEQAASAVERGWRRAREYSWTASARRLLEAYARALERRSAA
jgi:glycosyltransferase involved in cell wall biosynthesis